MKVMGIINCTPDSFSDGGQFLRLSDALDQISSFLEVGVDLIDVGGQSTRPGAVEVSAKDEWLRILPLLAGIGDQFGKQILKKVSVDSFYPELWVRAVGEFGVGMINSVVGAQKEHAQTLRQLVELDPNLQFAAMHMHGSPQDMQEAPLDDDAVVTSELKKYQHELLSAGFLVENIWLDPGIGFGKTDKLNFRLIRHASQLSEDLQLLYGVSRKSFIGRWLGLPNPLDRDHASKGIELGLMSAGVGLVRTHAPAALCAARKMGAGIG